MAITSNWSDLINNGEIDGIPLSAEVKSNVNVWAKGAPGIELWANSWNSASNGFETAITPSQHALGYLVNDNAAVNIYTVDKSKANYSLYFPHSNSVNYCYGYWLSSPAGWSESHVMAVNYSGEVSSGNYYNYQNQYSFAFRPVVCLPTDITRAKLKHLSEAVIKVDGTTVGNKNIPVLKGNTSTISIDNSYGMENITYQSSDTTVATVNSSGVITGVELGTATITLTGATSGETKTFTVDVQPLLVGDTVSYTTTLNGQTLSNWKVFYVNGDYTYIILDDYLPRAAISSDLRTAYNLADGDGTTYAIKSATANRTEFINAMAITSNWSDLINNGEIDGIPLSAEVKSNANVWAKGAPNLELWANSWNSTSNEFTTTIIPSYDEPFEIQSEDKSKETYSLYFPYSSVVDSCYGYWIASPSDNGGEYVRAEVYADWVSCGSCTEGVLAFRPVICLPSSLIK